MEDRRHVLENHNNLIEASRRLRDYAREIVASARASVAASRALVRRIAEKDAMPERTGSDDDRTPRHFKASRSKA